jgi:hypothetical protein
MLKELKGDERKKTSTAEEERMIKRDETPELGSDESQRQNKMTGRRDWRHKERASG